MTYAGLLYFLVIKQWLEKLEPILQLVADVFNRFWNFTLFDIPICKVYVHSMPSLNIEHAKGRSSAIKWPFKQLYFWISFFGNNGVKAERENWLLWTFYANFHWIIIHSNFQALSHCLKRWALDHQRDQQQVWEMVEWYSAWVPRAMLRVLYWWRAKVSLSFHQTSEHIETNFTLKYLSGNNPCRFSCLDYYWFG